MKSVYSFIVEPIGERYKNTSKVGDVELVMNTEMFNHQYVNREAIVKSIPLVNNTNVNVGDTVLIHHNVFRRWENIRGEEKNSKAFIDDKNYLVSEDQMFLYKNKGSWKCLSGFCFVKPIESSVKFEKKTEQPFIGVVKHTDGSFKKGDLVGFHPGSEYEFIVDGERLYRVKSNFITIQYEYQGNEKEYNPSWAQSG